MVSEIFRESLIISVVSVFYAYRLCVSRHDSASVLIRSCCRRLASCHHLRSCTFSWYPSYWENLLQLWSVLLENFEVFASFITVERPTGLTVGFEFWSLIESSTDSSNPELFISLLQDWLGEGVELCSSITIFSGKNNVRVSARRSLQYSISHCVSWESMLRIWS